MKNTLDGSNRGCGGVEQQSERQCNGSTQATEQKEKRILIMKTGEGTSAATSHVLTFAL